MSAECTFFVWRVILRNPGAKVVALCLADMAGEDGISFPSLRYICQYCSMEEVAVRNHLSYLSSIKLITKQPRFQGGRQTSNAYKFAILEDSEALAAGLKLIPQKRKRGEGIENRQGEGVVFREGEGIENHHPKNLKVLNLPKEKEGKGDAGAPLAGFSDRNRRPVPDSEDQMYELLEAAGIDINPDRDGRFFESMAKADWRIKGKRVADWMAVYEARVEKANDDCKVRPVFGRRF